MMLRTHGRQICEDSARILFTEFAIGNNGATIVIFDFNVNSYVIHGKHSVSLFWCLQYADLDTRQVHVEFLPCDHCDWASELRIGLKWTNFPQLPAT